MLLQLLFIPVAHADQVVVTSGRVVYDPFGRVVRVYHPTVDSERVDSFSRAVDNVAPTRTEYDELDRPLKVTLPDGTYTTYAYSLVGNALKTTVTDAEGNSSATVVNGSGKTVQSIQYKGGPDSEALTTAFAYDGIGRLVSVTDTEGNVTESTYDYGDRRIRVVHPASGETNYTYDRLGNVLTVQTANLKDGGSHVEYTYDRGRPTSVVYPEHPENNVYYHYGTADEPDTHNDLYGRLKFVEDGSGGTEYRYDAMGNVNRMRRTLSIPGEMVATANFEWRYDSFGKLLGMTYPAIRSAHGERVAYRYDRSGQLQSVYNNNTEGYYYARDIGYDRFGSQVHMEYGNGASTDYAYIPTNRRLRNISVSTSGGSAFTFGRAYTYDRVGNILALTSSTGGTGTLFPPVSHEYRYDNLYRLVGSNGYTIDGGQMSAIDSLTMTYDDMYRITGKTLVMSQQNVQFDGTLSAGYTLGYNYNTATGRKFQMSSVTDVNYRVASATVSNSDKIDERHTYEYDRNGNITYAGTARKRGDRAYRDRTREEKFRWDEANRLLAISQDGYVSHYFYDASGERTVKMHGGNSAVFVNSQMSGRETGALSFSAYFNPYFSIHDGTRFTKHLYIGSERIASMTGELDEDYFDVANNNNIVHAGVEVNVNTNDLHIPYNDRCYAMRDSIDGNYSYFGLHSGLDWSGVQLRALSLPCHGEEDGSVSNGSGSIPRSQGSGTGNDYPSRYGSIWYFHKDHLGSSTLITDGTGSISQQVEYLPYGEVFLERQHNSDPNQPFYATPYKFNGKELDEETGLYYYGARYMSPRLSIWYATDPLQEKYPNITSYAYCAGNPILLKDIDGRDAILIVFPDYSINIYKTPEIKIPFIRKNIKSRKINTNTVGHAGILLIDNKSGLTKYYEYGRYKTNDGTSGKVRNITVPNVKIGKDGKPTNESLNNVLKTLSGEAGKNGRIVGAYVISSEFDKMNSYAINKLNESNIGNPSYNKEREPYSIWNNNCGTFSVDVIKQDKSVDIPTIINPSPVNIVNEFLEEGNAKVLYFPQNNKTYIGKGDEADAKK